MQYGIKLPYDILTGEMSEISRAICDAFGGRDCLLRYYAENLGVVEIATVYPNTEGEMLLSACRVCASHGLAVTLHGTMDGCQDAVSFFSPYVALFASGLQKTYTVSVHPRSDARETERLLSVICAEAEKQRYPVKIMLENQRDKEGTHPHTRCRAVADAVRRIASPYLGMCLDFGHRLSNLRLHGDGTDPMDNADFSLVGHTHIHAVLGDATHFPLDSGECMLEEYLTPLLKRGYDGTFLLELLPQRYRNRFDIRASIVHSISILKTAVSQVQTKMLTVSCYRERYSASVLQVERAIASYPRALGVLGPSAYILKMGETRIAVDPSLWELPVSEDGRAVLIDALNACDAVVITHIHGDHFDSEILALISEDVPVYLPDFLSLERKNVISATPGQVYAIGETNLILFESEHSEVLPDGRFCHVPEYGFAVRFGEEHFVFPTDVRTYEKAHAVFPNTAVVVAHLWLGREQGLNVHDNSFVDPFCAFVESFGARRVLLSHMFDVRRGISAMWNDVHADLLKTRLPDARALRLGDVIKL